MQPKLSELNIYPVKGCGSVKVSSINYKQHGPEWDRAWMFVDCENKFISQRSYPQLALCKVRQEENKFQIFFPNVNNWFDLYSRSDESNLIKLDVWGNEVQGFVQNSIPAEILNSFFGKELKLVFFNDEFKRQVTVAGKAIQATTRFSDSQPILVVNSKSLDDLNAKLIEKINIDRFRANIIIDSDQPWEEEQWKEIHFPNLKLKQTKKAARCVVINVNQQTAVVKAEPLKQLASFKKVENKIFFGVYYYAEQSGVIKNTDQLKVII